MSADLTSLLSVPLQRRLVEARFLNKVQRNTLTGCWIWNAALDPNGYGRFGITRVRTRSRTRTFLSHRVSYELFCGSAGEQYVLHKCDTPACVNPTHLFLGTQQDNITDAVKKGRLAHGMKCGSARLNSDQVAEIRRRAKAGVTRPQLAREYGVTRWHIRNLVLMHCRKTDGLLLDEGE